MSNAPVCRPRFKGIENFLRRIAFNLGNTPSQTEVKIISCIPIDVTDLQNKIIDLEKELDERVSPGRAGPRETVACNTMLVGPSRGPSCGPSNRRMPCPRDSTADDSSGNCSLHPGACNPVSSACVGLIGKVKKMSKKRSKCCKPQMVYYAQTTSRSPFKQSSPCRSKSPYPDNAPYNRNSPHRQHHDETHFGKRRSHDRAGERGAERTERAERAERAERTERAERAERAAERIADWTNERMNDRIVDWNRDHTAMCAGLERNEGVDDGNLLVTDAVRRMYQHERLPPESTLSSHFSVPVCRDEPPPSRATPPQSDGDLCSCCHGLVHNLDVGRSPAYVTANTKEHREHNAYYDSSLYDLVPVKERTTQKRNDEIMSPIREEKESPVTYYKGKVLYGGQTQPPRAGHHKLHCKRKKLPMKTTLKRERVLKAMQKRKLDRLASVGTIQTNSVECGRVYVKYRGKAHAVHLPRWSRSPHHLRSPHHSRSPVHSRLPQHLQLQLQLPVRSPPPAPPPSPPVEMPTRHPQRNAEVLTINCNEIECQTATSRSVQLEPPVMVEETHKTEATLDQIKSILHAVLTEVKTNTVIKGVTKDAVVQKGRSQSNLPLQSYGSSYGTYNGSSMAPNMPAGMSANMAGGMTTTMPGMTNTMPCAMSNVMQGGMPVNMPNAISNTIPSMMSPTTMADKNYMQNYPLFIHTIGRQCACCNRTLTEGTRANPIAANTATNTDLMARTNFRNKETEKLIKEIYKSIATDQAQRNDSGSDGRSMEEVNRRKYKSKLDSEARARMVMESLTKSEKREATVSYGGRARGVSHSSTPSHSATTVCRLQFDEESAETSDRGQTMPTSLEPSPSRMTHVSSASRSHRVSRDQSQAPSHTSSAELSREISRDSTPERLPRPRSRGHSRVHSRLHSRVHSRAHSRHARDTPEESPARGARHKAQDSEEDSDTDVTVVNAEKYETQKKKKGLLRNVIGKLFATGRVKRPERRGKADVKSMASEAVANDVATDSDDYETIVSQSQYSANSEDAPVHKRRHYARRGSGSGASQEDDRASLRRRHHRKPTRYMSPYAHVARHKRSAYMEQQEYRRHWNESVPYHGGDAHAEYSGRGGRSRRRPYFQQYETRAAMVHRAAEEDHHRHEERPRKPAPKPQTHAIPKKGFHLNITKSATQGLRWLKKRKTAARH